MRQGKLESHPRSRAAKYQIIGSMYVSKQVGREAYMLVYQYTIHGEVTHSAVNKRLVMMSVSPMATPMTDVIL